MRGKKRGEFSGRHPRRLKINDLQMLHVKAPTKKNAPEGDEPK